MKRKIVLYDDERRIAHNYVESLQKIEDVNRDFEVSSLDNATFGKELDALETRRNNFRNNEINNPDSLLDETSIFIIDSDLLKYSEKGYLNGEDVAYLARCFSKCLLIIGLNQFNRPDETIFDLTLKGHPESYCDLNVSSTQICNPGLWGKNRLKFRPWHWPDLSKFVESSEKRITETKNHLDDSIVEVLGLNDAVNEFSPATNEFIGSDPEKATFREFAMHSGRGLKAKDVNLDEEVLIRIAEARLSKWLERLVLTGQDILVDAPHLVSRYPSLLKTDHKSRDEWNKTTNLINTKDLPLDYEKIEQYMFKKECWLSRPAWLWSNLSNSSIIEEVSEPWKKENTKFRFCEDSTTFESGKNYREFRAGVDTVYVQRFINNPLIERVDYQPRARLL
jgi:hypothetical protein